MALSSTTIIKLINNNKPYHWSRTYIKTIQTLLNKCGWKLVVDGILGAKTVTAIYEFQAKYGLVKDGIPGTKTLAKLKAVTAPSATAGTGTSIYMTAADWANTKYFKPSELAAKDGYQHGIYKSLIKALTMIRTHFNAPVNITSGLRSPVTNARLSGSSPTSGHLFGAAADFYVSGVSKSAVLAYCKYLKSKGYITYTYSNSTNMAHAVHINVKYSLK